MCSLPTCCPHGLPKGGLTGPAPPRWRISAGISEKCTYHPPRGASSVFIRCASHSLILVHPSVICVWADRGERRIFASKEITKKEHRLMRLTIPSAAIMLSALCAPLRAALADTLSLHQQSIVAIAASAATGALEHLRTALARGLDGGMTVNETKEVMVHAYAYCGFPAACVVCRPPHAGARRAQSAGHRRHCGARRASPSATAATSTPAARSCSKS